MAVAVLPDFPATLDFDAPTSPAVPSGLWARSSSLSTQQGSASGTPVFIYTHSLSRLFQTHGFRFHLYADGSRTDVSPDLYAQVPTCHGGMSWRHLKLSTPMSKS